MVIRSHHPTLCRKLVSKEIKNLGNRSVLYPDLLSQGCPCGAVRQGKRNINDAGYSVIFFKHMPIGQSIGERQ